MKIDVMARRTVGPRGGRVTPVALGGILLLVVVAGGALSYQLWLRDQATALAQLRNVKYPIDSLVGTLRALHFPTDEVRKETEKRLRFEVALLKGVIDRAKNEEQLRSVGITLTRIGEVCPASLAPLFEQMQKRLTVRAEEIDFHRLDALVARDQPYTGAAESYLKKYPAGANLDRVKGWLSRAKERAELKDINELDSFKPSDRAELEQKRDMLRKFAEKFPIYKEVAEIKQAAELADRLLQLKTVRVKAIAAGKFNTARSFSVKILVDGKERLEVQTQDAVQEASWNADFSFDWSVGQPLKVVLYNYTWRNRDAASLEQTGLVTLRFLDGRRELDAVDSWDAYFEGKPWIQFQTLDFSAEEWALIDRFVVPVSR